MHSTLPVPGWCWFDDQFSNSCHRPVVSITIHRLTDINTVYFNNGTVTVVMVGWYTNIKFNTTPGWLVESINLTTTCMDKS